MRVDSRLVPAFVYRAGEKIVCNRKLVRNVWTADYPAAAEQGALKAHLRENRLQELTIGFREPLGNLEMVQAGQV